MSQTEHKSKGRIMTLSPFASWDSLDPAELEACASRIRRSSPAGLKRAAFAQFKNLPNWLLRDSRSFCISGQSLLNISGAAIAATFSKYPLGGDDFEIIGMARFIKLEGEYIPTILLFPEADSTVIRHESIHLCQWLNPTPYPLTAEETHLIASQDLERAIKTVLKTGPERALDFIIRAVCYKVWTELEAYFFAEGEKGLRPEDVVKCAQRSAQPFITFQRALSECGLYAHVPAAMKCCEERFLGFCKEIQDHVPWVQSLLKKGGNDSLHEALWWCKEEDEMDDMFGPLEG